MTDAALIGRFQPLHRGHQEIIESARQKYESVTIVVGSAGESGTEENPLGFEDRKKIVESCFPELETVPLEDTQKTDEGNKRWAEKLSARVDADVVISGNDLVRSIVDEKTDMEPVKPELRKPKIYSGTEIRRRIRSGEEWRYLVPDCAEETVEEQLETIRESGIDYEFTPGWKRENAYHGTEKDR